MTPLLSILIPTVIGREKQLDSLLWSIKKQCGHVCLEVITSEYGLDLHILEFLNYPVSIIIAADDKQMSIGMKRERLYELSPGEYSWQIDDDDAISDNAIQLIDSAIALKPQCITFREKCIINGQYFSSNHSIKYDKWQDNFDGFDFVRCPFFKDVIRTNIASMVPFANIRWNEDEQWSMDLMDHLTQEIHIDQELYIYQHNSKPEDHNERYGITQ